MTTVSLLVNGTEESEGDAGINMVSGFNCLSKMETIALKEKSENFQIELKNALTGVINNCETKKNDKEIQYLKELIVSHLDIIQQQAEQLAIKDRLISKLKNEKETLVMRLVRIERRVNLENSRSASQTEEPANAAAARLLHPATSRTQRRPSTEISAKGGSSKQSAAPLPPTSSSPFNTSREPKKIKRSRHPSDEGSSEGVQDGSSSSSGSSRRGSTKLTSDKLYFTLVGEQECRWGVEPLQAKPHSLLEVPSWRIKSYSSSYTMEGTENLQDDMFERRHTNLYKDEKRRKRWDVQRIREMRHNERLRQRQVGLSSAAHTNKSHANHMTESLWPRPTRDTQLIVHQSVPVAAFAITLHTLPQRDFQFSSFTMPSTKSSKGFKKAKR